VPEPVFHLDGDLIVPTELARGPWDPNGQHGGPVAAALARAIERCEPDEDVFVMSVVVDLLRPVPLSPLRTEARLTRGGKRVQLVDAMLFDGDELVARAAAWRRRTADGSTPLIQPAASMAPPETGHQWRPRMDGIGFWTAVEWRFVSGEFEGIGPSGGWCRLRATLFDGEEPTPLQRTLVAADFGNGISGELDFNRYLFINVDLAVHLHRLPTGEWIGVDASTTVGSQGTGVARTTLQDEKGPIGVGVQELYIDRRPG